MIYFLIFGVGLVAGIALVLLGLVLASASVEALKNFDE